MHGRFYKQKLKIERGVLQHPKRPPESATDKYLTLDQVIPLVEAPRSLASMGTAMRPLVYNLLEHLSSP